MNTTQILVGIPQKFIEGFLRGEYYIDGVMLKSVATHHIVAHLEQITPVLDFSFKTLMHLPTLDWISGIAETLWTDYRLRQVLHIVHQVQSLTILNTALLGVSIGTNLVGFHLIGKKLDMLDQKLVSIDEKLSSLIRTNQEKHLKKILILIKNSIDFADSLENDGLSNALDVQIIPTLNELEMELKFLIEDYRKREANRIPLDYVQVVYAAYANLLKAYLTARYLVQKPLQNQQQRVETLQSLGRILIAPAILGLLYEQCVYTTEKLLTEPEIEDIITLYKVGCHQSVQRVKAQLEILSQTPIEDYEQWQRQVSAAEGSFVWVEH